MRHVQASVRALPLRVAGGSVLALAVALVSACSGRSLDIGGPADDGGSGTDTGSSDAASASSATSDGALAVGPALAAADFCRDYTLAVCKALAACCGTHTGGVFDDTTCVSVVRGECDGSLTSAASSGASYVPELGASCITKAAGEVCSAQMTSVPDLCPGLFRGSAPAGASCNAVYSCAEGLACAPQPLGDAGPCTGPQPCDPATIEACTKLPVGGQPCFQGYNNGTVSLCADGFACKANQVCQPIHFAAVGAACTDIEQCQKGLFCDAKTSVCAAPRGDAEPCVDHTGCTSDTCTDHVCTPAQPQPVRFCKG